MIGMAMIVSPMISLVIVLVIPGCSAMCRIMVVLMCMLVAMVMNMFMVMLHVSMRVLMGMNMRVSVVMQMIVFVFSFHHHTSFAADYYRLSIDLNYICFRIFFSGCQRVNRQYKYFESGAEAFYTFFFGQPLNAYKEFKTSLKNNFFLNTTLNFSDPQYALLTVPRHLR